LSRRLRRAVSTSLVHGNRLSNAVNRIIVVDATYCCCGLSLISKKQLQLLRIKKKTWFSGVHRYCGIGHVSITA
jgi:hypothetical protein